MKVAEILETCLYVDDLAGAENFYRQVLGLQVMAREEGRHVFFRCGRGMFLVFNPNHTSETHGEIPPHGARGPSHVAFGIRASDLAQWRQHLQRCAVAIEKDYRWPNGGQSIYFRDPAGNSVELATPSVWSIAERDFFGS